MCRFCIKNLIRLTPFSCSDLSISFLYTYTGCGRNNSHILKGNKNQRKQALRPNAGHGFLILEVSRSHTTTHHSRWNSSGRVTSSSQRPLRYNTQHSQQTDIHAPDGIRTHNLNRRAAADLRLRPRGHWDRQLHKVV